MTNEELLDELIRRARLSVGKLTGGEACCGEYAAVLARMAGPGEVARAVAAEREACAKVVDDWAAVSFPAGEEEAASLAAAIRARGPK